MSRNFELLQRVNADMHVGAAAPAAAAILPNAGVAGDSVQPRAVAPCESAWCRPAGGTVPADIRKLVTRLFFAPDGAEVRVVVFGGIEVGPQSAQLCAVTAEALSGMTMTAVGVVDANLESPILHEFFGVRREPGLAELLSGSASFGEAMQPVPNRNLTLIPAGRQAASWQACLAAPRTAEIFGELQRNFNYLLVSGPSLQEWTAAAAGVARLSDGLVMMVEANQTRRDVTCKVREQLQSYQVRLLGAVLNNCTFPIPQSIYSRL